MKLLAMSLSTVGDGLTKAKRAKQKEPEREKLGDVIGFCGALAGYARAG